MRYFMKDSLIFYITQYEAVKELNNEQLGRLFRALFETQIQNNSKQLKNNSKEVVLEDDIKIAFNFINNQLVVDNKKYQDKVEKLRINAKKGGAPKGNQNAKKQPKQPNNQIECDNDNDNDNVNVNDNVVVKENDKKKVHFADFVSMTNAEYEKLVDTHGKDFADQCISVLDNYKGSTGKKYKDDYRAILSWVIDKVQKEKPKQPQTTNPFLKYMLDRGEEE